MELCCMSDNATPKLTHALSFDIEDWFHIVEIPAVEDPALWPELSEKSSIVERYTDLILETCAEFDTKATFFILGWIAERHPDLVRRIADAGHEIATHSYWHRKVYELTPDSFTEDLKHSIDVIQQACSAEIAGFRAPSFSITEDATWAFDALLDCGIKYDASLFPAKRGHGGCSCQPGAHVVTAPSGRKISELPMSIGQFGPSRLCYSGGGYMRLLPMSMIRHGVKTEAAAGRPTVVYLHPRDFAPDCPRAKMPLHRRFKCYVGLASTIRKLRGLLQEYQWDTCASVLAHELDDESLVQYGAAS